jgi:hypothetical protein
MAVYGTATYAGCVDRAVDAFNNKVFWAGLGRTTEWDDPDVPPDLDRTTTAIEEPIVYVIPDVISLCVPVNSGGDVTVGGQDYAFVEAGDAFTELARFVYIKAVFNPDITFGLPYANYRQCGILSDLVPVSGHENDQWLAPANVEDAGLLQIYLNLTVRTYGLGSPTTIETILEYR